MRRAFLTVLASVMLLLEAGCTFLGSWSLTRDRFNYMSAISTSWKDQMLVNLVMLRYGEPPVFVEVASIISQYQLAGGLNALFSWVGPPSLNSQSVGGSAAYSERPTVTYNLLAGQKFARSLAKDI